MNTNGLIIHNTRHSPGRVHDVKVYRMKHPALPSGLPSRDGSDGKKGKTKVRVYTDRDYPGAQKMYEEMEALAPIRRKPGKKPLALEKEFNRLYSKIRVYVGARHPQGQDLADNGRGVPEPAEEVRPDQ